MPLLKAQGVTACFKEEVLDEIHEDTKGSVCYEGEAEAIQIARKNPASEKGSVVLANTSR